MSAQIQNISQLVKVSGLQLAPFFKSVIIYFVIYSFEFWQSNLLSTILKCAPIISLMAFLFMNNLKFSNGNRYHKLLLGGLIFSCMGDAFLDYQQGKLFELGMAAFAVAQIFYITMFGFTPLKIWIGLIFYSIGFISVALFFNSLTDILVFAVPIYCLLLLTMGWRSVARVENFKSIPQVLCAFGGISFVISDTLIAFNLFLTPIKYAQIYIMITYYFAQFGITLSVLDITKKEKKSH
ncbi:hypothetical protein PVAND_002124 [Polypedilum vanderplanki]|uniref:lysoplasmalogenase n=1 Tax=Polypedilum vanderplanki TaxID=319348 RepID=A0A9J6BRF8_POLVA|nr:hypothetical protein PVAND_002124 [Polypedilum vanderplanki]